jgi:hypothetical protein
MEFNRITFNGKRSGLSVATEWIRALNDPRVLQEKAGFLFKASFDGDCLMLAVAPTLINGERSYHYNLRLEKEDAFTLIGDVNAQGVFTILFKPESRAAVSQHATEYIGRFRSLAAFLKTTGYTGAGRLDEVTQDILRTLGLSPVPESLSDL